MQACIKIYYGLLPPSVILWRNRPCILVVYYFIGQEAILCIYTVYHNYYFIDHVAFRSGDMFGRGNDSDVILLSEVDCTGDEEHLINCSYTTPICIHSEDAAVSCINASGT